MPRDRFTQLVIKLTGVIVLFIVLSKLTHGLAMVAMLVLGIWYSFTNHTAKALMFYVLYPFFAILNGMIVPHMPMFSVITRVGTLVMTFAMCLSAARRPGSERLPLGTIFIYVLVAVISSMGGYLPIVSYLKIVNFVVFILGLTLGVRNIHHRPEDILYLRATCIALACVLVFGSIATLPFPGIAYSTTVKAMVVLDQFGGDVNTIAREVVANNGMMLFAGITNQSQCLSPLLSCVTAMVACDMVLVEKKMSKLHLALIFCSVPLMYMTRSRVAFFSLAVTIVLMCAYTMPKARLSVALKRKITSGVYMALGMLFCVAVAAEATNHTVSKWLRKTQDVSADSRDLGDALTASRQGKIELQMQDYYRNPLLGMGFQVNEDLVILHQIGRVSYFSAPVEKGLLPLVILGECGIVGCCAFVIFLSCFFASCARKKYIATATLFVILLTTNMGEATFFSPSGGGGILWLVCLVGGFVIDMSVKYGARLPGQSGVRWLQ